MKRNNDFRELVCGANGIISSKRVMGVLVLLVCLGCTIWLVISEGGTQIVENLLQTLMVMAAALLGISSITSIWRKNNINNTSNTTENKSDNHKEFDPEDPCINCIYNKKETE